MAVTRIPIGGSRMSKAAGTKVREFIPKNLKVGDIISFGRYNQTPHAYVELIDWRVLSMDATSALVISEKILEAMPFDKSKSRTNKWEDCSLREWLNTTFYNDAFNDDEKNIIFETILPNGKNFFRQDKEIVDKVFLLSDEEVENFMLEKDEKYGEPTYHCIKKGACFRSAEKSWWWLRTPSALKRMVHGVYQGELEGIAFSGDYDKGVRPAVVISLLPPQQPASPQEIQIQYNPYAYQQPMNPQQK